MKGALSFLKEEFDFLGRINEADFKAGLADILSRISSDSTIIVLEANDQVVDWNTGNATPVPVLANLNAWTRDVCQDFANVVMLRTSKSSTRNQICNPFYASTTCRMWFILIAKYIFECLSVSLLSFKITPVPGSRRSARWNWPEQGTQHDRGASCSHPARVGDRHLIDRCVLMNGQDQSK